MARIYRGGAEAIQNNGAAMGVSTATIERGEAEAIQNNGAATGASTATIRRGEAEANTTGPPAGAVRRE